MSSLRLCLGKGVYLILLVTSVVCAIACGTDSTPMPTPTSPPTTEGLIDRAMARSSAIINGNWMEVYNYIHPDYKASCTAGEYALDRGAFYRELADMMGIPENIKQSDLFRLRHNLDKDAEIEDRVEEVWQAGNEGFIDIDSYHNGKHIDFFAGESLDVGTYWEYFEGDWYVTNKFLEC